MSFISDKTQWIKKLFSQSYKPEDIIRRDWHNTEIFPPNHFYGNASIIKRYSAFPLHKPLKVILQHGPYMETGNFTGGGELEANLPFFCPPTEERAGVYSFTSGGKKSIPIGIPYLYIEPLLNEATSTIKGKGTLVFPSHSTKFITKIFNHDAYARKLLSLPNQFHPISVCCYWRDYELGFYNTYRDYGLELVSAGHMEDPDFLVNLYILFKRHQFSCGNEPGSHIFYSIAAGTPYFILPSDHIDWAVSNERHLENHYRELPAYREIDELFSTPVKKITTSQKEFVDRYLGPEHLKSPQELNRILLLAERDDWVSIQPSPNSQNKMYHSYYYRIPTKFQRFKWIKSLFKVRNS